MWIIDNLNNALDTWNSKLAEIWQLLTQSPETFKGGSIWNVVVGINGALQAIGYALLPLQQKIHLIKIKGGILKGFTVIDPNWKNWELEQFLNKLNIK